MNDYSSTEKCNGIITTINLASSWPVNEILEFSLQKHQPQRYTHVSQFPQHLFRIFRETKAFCYETISRNINFHTRWIESRENLRNTFDELEFARHAKRARGEVFVLADWIFADRVRNYRGNYCLCRCFFAWLMFDTARPLRKSQRTRCLTIKLSDANESMRN